MTSIAPQATPIATPAGQLDPALVAAVQSLPADQQQRAMAELQKLTPEQQAQVIAQMSQKTTPQQAQATTSVSPADQAATGAIAAAPPNKMKTILKSVGIFGAAGAALGFGASFLSLPVVGQVAAPIAAAIGGGIGAIAGLVKGMMDFKKEQQAYDAAVGTQGAPAAEAPPVEPPPSTQPAEAPPPPAAEPGDATPARGRSYTVRPSDNLSVIAARYDLTWKQLYRANRDAVGSNPDLIHPGLRLTIPAP